MVTMPTNTPADAEYGLCPHCGCDCGDPHDRPECAAVVRGQMTDLQARCASRGLIHPTQPIRSAREEIAHGCDGPLTSFVLIARACDLIATGTDPEIVANALHEELSERGMLIEGNVEVPGS